MNTNELNLTALQGTETQIARASEVRENHLSQLLEIAASLDDQVQRECIERGVEELGKIASAGFWLARLSWRNMIETQHSAIAAVREYPDTAPRVRAIMEQATSALNYAMDMQARGEIPTYSLKQFAQVVDSSGEPQQIGFRNTEATTKMTLAQAQQAARDFGLAVVEKQEWVQD